MSPVETILALVVNEEDAAKEDTNLLRDAIGKQGDLEILHRLQLAQTQVEHFEQERPRRLVGTTVCVLRGQNLLEISAGLRLDRDLSISRCGIDGREANMGRRRFEMFSNLGRHLVVKHLLAQHEFKGLLFTIRRELGEEFDRQPIVEVIVKVFHIWIAARLTDLGDPITHVSMCILLPVIGSSSSLSFIVHLLETDHITVLNFGLMQSLLRLHRLDHRRLDLFV